MKGLPETSHREQHQHPNPAVDLALYRQVVRDLTCGFSRFNFSLKPTIVEM